MKEALKPNKEFLEKNKMNMNKHPHCSAEYSGTA